MIFYDRVFIFLSVLSGTVQRVRGFLYFRAVSQKLFRRKFIRNLCETAREAFPAEAIFYGVIRRGWRPRQPVKSYQFFSIQQY